MYKKDLEKRMLELDNIVSDLYPNKQFKCVIVGGGALLINDWIYRATLDVDIISVSKDVENLFESFDFNTRVQGLIHCFPYHYEDRLELIHLKTKAIQFYTPSIEDLIVSKLYAFRPKDIDDLTNIKASGNFDPILLSKIVVESKDSALNERSYHEMVNLYQRFFKEVKS